MNITNTYLSRYWWLLRALLGPDSYQAAIRCLLLAIKKNPYSKRGLIATELLKRNGQRYP